MIYKANYLPNRAKIGDKYVIKFFALFPFEINREVRWLETVYVEYEAVASTYYKMMHPEIKYKSLDWKPLRFVTKEHYEDFP